MLRDKCVHEANKGSFWATSLLFSLIQELTPLWDFEQQALDSTYKPLGLSMLTLKFYVVSQAAKRIEAYNAFVTRVEELDLPSAVDASPLLNVRVLYFPATVIR
jgi:tRNA nucleotidyltransferase (CCA-adding enzyme)